MYYLSFLKSPAFLCEEEGGGGFEGPLSPLEFFILHPSIGASFQLHVQIQVQSLLLGSILYGTVSGSALLGIVWLLWWFPALDQQRGASLPVGVELVISVGT